MNHWSQRSNWPGLRRSRLAAFDVIIEGGDINVGGAAPIVDAQVGPLLVEQVSEEKNIRRTLLERDFRRIGKGRPGQGPLRRGIDGRSGSGDDAVAEPTRAANGPARPAVGEGRRPTATTKSEPEPRCLAVESRPRGPFMEIANVDGLAPLLSGASRSVSHRGGRGRFRKMHYSYVNSKTPPSPDE